MLLRSRTAARTRGLTGRAGPRTRHATPPPRGQPAPGGSPSTRAATMVDLAELARQMKAIGRKGSGKDYYEQYVAAGIANGEKRAARAAPDGRVPLPDWLVNYGVPLRPASAPAARRTDGRRVRDDPVYHKTGVLYAQYDGGALQRPRVVHQASVASTATPADSVAKWPTRWRQKGGRNLPLPLLRRPSPVKRCKHKRDRSPPRRRSTRAISECEVARGCGFPPPRLMHEALAASLDPASGKEFRREWRRWVHEDCRFFGRPGSGIFGDEAYPMPFGADRGISTPLRLETAAAERSGLRVHLAEPRRFKNLEAEKGDDGGLAVGVPRVVGRLGGDRDAGRRLCGRPPAHRPRRRPLLAGAGPSPAPACPGARPAPAPPRPAKGPAPVPRLPPRRRPRSLSAAAPSRRATGAAPAAASARRHRVRGPRPPRRRRGSYFWEGRDEDGEHIDRRSRELIERTGIRFETRAASQRRASRASGPCATSRRASERRRRARWPVLQTEAANGGAAVPEDRGVCVCRSPGRAAAAAQGGLLFLRGARAHACNGV